MTTIPPIVSVDDHVVEPRDLWQRYLPSRLKDRGPRVVQAPYDIVPEGRELVRVGTEGPLTDFWIYENLRAPIVTGMASVGLEPSEISTDPISYDQMRKGCWDRDARLADMDVNHIERSLCFPTFPRFAGQTFYWAQDKDLALECVRAYNDWMVEEWAGESGGRLIPLCLIPLWDPEEAAREVRRNAARGVAAVTFTELPYAIGLPSIHDANGYWLPFFEACDETGTVICIHIGSSSQFQTTSRDAPGAVIAALTSMNSQMSLIDWLFSGHLASYPNLKLAFSESQIGWMPFVLERVDRIWEQNNAVMRARDKTPNPPSTYFNGRVYGCFFEDDFGLQSRGTIGLNQITFESDYPHQDSTWPNTLAYAQEAMADIPQNEVDLIVRGNAIELFRLPETLS